MPGAHLRFRPIVARNSSGAAVHAVFTELGLSRGTYSGGLADATGASMCETCDEDPTYRPKTVWWGQAELGWEIRWVSGVLLRASTGIAAIISEPSWQCTKSGTSVPCTGERPMGWVESGTFAIGYAFQIRDHDGAPFQLNHSPQRNAPPCFGSSLSSPVEPVRPLEEKRRGPRATSANIVNWRGNWTDSGTLTVAALQTHLPREV
jgi:hypothetical protein